MVHLYNITSCTLCQYYLDNDLAKFDERMLNGTNGVESFLLKTTEGVSNFLGHFLMGAPLVTMGIQSFGDKTYQNLKEGYDINTAILNGATTATVSMLTEKLPLDNFTKLINSNVGQFTLGAIASQALNEGMEEGLEAIIEPMIDSLVLGKELEYQPNEIFMSVALGIATGGILGFGANTVPYIKNQRSVNQLKADMQTLEDFRNNNDLTIEENEAIDYALSVSNTAIDNFNNKSKIGEYVRFKSDEVTPKNYQEIMDNLFKSIKPTSDFEAKQKANAEYARQSLFDEAQNRLYQKGINMNIEQYLNLDENTKIDLDKLNGYAHDLKVNIAYDTNLNADGLFNPNTGQIVINPNSEKAMLSTFIHELTHGNESSKYYQPLKDFAKQYVNENVDGGWDSYLNYLGSNSYKGLSNEALEQETTAIAMQENLADEKFIKSLIKYNESLAYRIYDEIKYLVSKGDKYSQNIEYNFKKAFYDKEKELGDETKYAIKNVDGIVKGKKYKRQNINYKKKAEIRSIINTDYKIVTPGWNVVALGTLNDNYLVYVYGFDNYDIYSRVTERGLNEYGLIRENSINDISRIDGTRGGQNKFILNGKSNGNSSSSRAVSRLSSEHKRQKSGRRRSTGYDGGDKRQYSIGESIISHDSNGDELTPKQASYFKNTKAIDENGDLQVVYHGSTSSPFYSFDRNKANIENDWGKGFYTTTNYDDVVNNYEGGGPDYESKVSRLAEQISQDEEIDYSEAEEIARKKLGEDDYLIEAYVNVKNPAVVGETVVLNQEDYLDNYDIDDYESEEDYYYDIEQMASDDIEEAITEVDYELNLDPNTYEELRNILWEAYLNGGIDPLELKEKVNELYIESDEGLAGNEATRLILKSLGYDGIIDNTVSKRFNMGLSEDTKHIIAFDSNQIKDISNKAPTENYDIRYSKGDLIKRDDSHFKNSNEKDSLSIKDLDDSNIKNEIEEYYSLPKDSLNEFIEEIKEDIKSQGWHYMSTEENLKKYIYDNAITKVDVPFKKDAIEYFKNMTIYLDPKRSKDINGENMFRLNASLPNGIKFTKKKRNNVALDNVMEEFSDLSGFKYRSDIPEDQFKEVLDILQSSDYGPMSKYSQNIEYNLKKHSMIRKKN